MNKHVKYDNDDGYVRLKLAVGGACTNVSVTGEKEELHHISPSIVVDVLEGIGLEYKIMFITEGRGLYKVKFTVDFPNTVIIEVDVMSGKTTIGYKECCL